MLTALRGFLAFLAGLALAFVLVIALELFSAVVHPTPPGFTGSMEEMCQHVAHYPDWVLGVAALSWCATGLVSTWVATRIGNHWAGIVLALLLTAMLVFNISMLPYTVWFKVVMLASFPIACYWGVRSGSRKPAPLAAVVGN